MHANSMPRGFALPYQRGKLPVSAAKTTGILLASFCQALLLSGQPPAHPPVFDVVSIRPSDPATSIGALFSYPGGEVRCGICSLKTLVEIAFDVDSYQISNLPGWANSSDFAWDIDAKPFATAQSMLAWPTKRNTLDLTQRAMMIAMLKDRFQLKFHREERQGSVYILSRGSNPLKLEAVSGAPEGFWFGGPHDRGRISGDGIAGSNITMAELAARLRSWFERPVLDRTGLSGRYTFRYEYVTGDPHPDILATIIASLWEIGLKVELGKAPVRSIVIDRAEKPTAN